MNDSPSPNYWLPPPRPRQRSRFSGCLFRVLVVLIIIGGIYFWLTYQPSGRAADIAPAISSFTGEPNILVKQTGVEQTTYGTVKQYSANLKNGDQVYFDIDKNGVVASFFRAKQPNGEIHISIEQARETAMEFVTAHYQGLSWLDNASISENLTGTDSSSNRFYTFLWLGQDSESGAYLPQMLKIVVNAQTGQVDSCSMLNESVTILTVPAINKQTATQTALSALPKTPTFEAAEVLLIVTTTPIYESNGQQTLVWRITATAKPDNTGYVAGAVIFIDAQSGEILLIDPFV